MNSNTSVVIDGGLQIVGIIVLVLGIAVFLLWKSMNRQIKKINVDLPAGPEDERIAEDEHFTQEAIQAGENERGEDDPRT
ncbi:MAG: hypothetical protein ACO3LZ_01395 [Candidatus Nanopelagicales bacterium]|jgi:hypothetical protein